jgi:putative spermidine/putrescine transport system permease protein/spermidine/putrescine transport system permease protein
MNARSRLLDALLGGFAAAGLVVLYAPLLATATLSFFPLARRAGAVSLAPFTVEPYVRLAANREILAALGTSGGVGLAATLLPLAGGLMFAWYYVTTRGVRRQFMQAVVFLPFLLPPIITGLAQLIFFRDLGVPRGLATILVGHVVFIVPIVYRTILVRLQLLGPSLTEAALDLGATRAQAFRLVVLPQLRPALVAAALLAFSLSFDETLITLFLAGSVTTLPIRLWAMMRVGFVPEINALATVVLGLAAAVAGGVAIAQQRARHRAA